MWTLSKYFFIGAVEHLLWNPGLSLSSKTFLNLARSPTGANTSDEHVLRVVHFAIAGQHRNIIAEGVQKVVDVRQSAFRKMKVMPKNVFVRQLIKLNFTGRVDIVFDLDRWQSISPYDPASESVAMLMIASRGLDIQSSIPRSSPCQRKHIQVQFDFLWKLREQFNPSDGMSAVRRCPLLRPEW